MNITNSTALKPDRNPNNINSLAYRLAYALKQRQLTAAELSQMTENKNYGIKPIHPSTISLYMHGKSYPDVAKVQRLATALRVDVNWLLGSSSLEEINAPSSDKTGYSELAGLYLRLNDRGRQYLILTARITLSSLFFNTESGIRKEKNRL